MEKKTGRASGRAPDTRPKFPREDSLNSLSSGKFFISGTARRRAAGLALQASAVADKGEIPALAAGVAFVTLHLGLAELIQAVVRTFQDFAADGAGRLVCWPYRR